jgi:ribonuclease D
MEYEIMNVKNTFVNEAGLDLQIHNVYDILTRDQIKNKLKSPNNFKDICHDYLQVDISKEMGLKKWWVDELSIDQILYSAMDTIFCFMLRNI